MSVARLVVVVIAPSLRRWYKPGRPVALEGSAMGVELGLLAEDGEPQRSHDAAAAALLT
jgi:hypothetical protein